MTVAQARNVCPEVVVRGASPAALASVGTVLAGVARGFSPRVEVAGGGWVYLDVAGLAMFESEEAIRQGLLAAAAGLGVEVRAGIASSRGVARIAAQAGLGAVPPGGERRAIAPCRVELLFAPGPPFFGEGLRERLAPVLGRWGVRRIGEFARLPVREVQRRLGAGGAALHRLARGIDETPLAPEPCPESFEEAWETFDEIADAERLLAVLNTLVKRVLERIVLRRLHLARVRLEFTLEGGGKDDRTLELAAPTRDPAAALKLLRAELETRPLRAAVTAVRIGAEPVRARSAQASVFLPAGPAPEALNALLSRLGALCGEGRVGRPVVCDSLDPEAFEVAPFELPDLRRQLSAAPPGALALHAFRPWIALPGGSDETAPGSVLAGPYRLRAHWWTQWPIERDEYDLLFADGGLYRAVHDLNNDSWWLRGRYE
jgi:protein ImuB